MRLTKNEHFPTLNYVHRRARDSLRNQHILPCLHGLQLQRDALSKKTLTQAAPPSSSLMPLFDRRVSIQLLLVVGALCFVFCSVVVLPHLGHREWAIRLVSSRLVSSRPRVLGMHSTWMQIERKYQWGIQKNVRITNLRRSNGKVTWLVEIPREHDRLVIYTKTIAWFHDMEGHDQKCSERFCELANKKVEQLYKVSSPLPGWSSIQAGRSRICPKTCRSLLANYIELLVFGQNW